MSLMFASTSNNSYEIIIYVYLVVYWHWQLSQELVCERRVGELEVSFVVELQ